MNDVIIGTIIGGIIGIISALVASVVKGIYDSKNIELKYEQDKKEKQTCIRISKRTPWLIEIEKQLQIITETVLDIEEYLKFLINQSKMCDDCVVWGDSASRECIEKMRVCNKLISDARKAIIKYITKVNNVNFYNSLRNNDLILELLSRNICELSNIREECGEGKLSETKNINTDIIEKCRCTLMTISEALVCLREANQRIEELLCGIEQQADD
jgi:hypothetical protein